MTSIVEPSTNPAQTAQQHNTHVVDQYVAPALDAPAVPFFRPALTEEEIEAVVSVLRSGWLTSGPQVKEFEKNFCQAVGAKHAIAVNSCTAAMHIAVEALGLKEGQGVLIPTMTFAATAEVVRYMGAVPILVDCDPITGNVDLQDAERRIVALRSKNQTEMDALFPTSIHGVTEIVGFMPVHVGGLMLDMDRVRAFAEKYQLWIVEDAAHALPAAYQNEKGDWRRCGENTAHVTCYSFYANKTITTGEGGMAVTDDEKLAARMRLMSLHGLSNDAWDRYRGGRTWDYRIVAPGFKYNLTDIAASLGVKQLERAESMRVERAAVAAKYHEALADVPQIALAPDDQTRLHPWHLFSTRLHLDMLRIDRNQFIDLLKDYRVGCSVHWRPLHLHTYYTDLYGWNETHIPTASALWLRLVTLPIFSGMRDDEIQRVVNVVRYLCGHYAK